MKNLKAMRAVDRKRKVKLTLKDRAEIRKGSIDVFLGRWPFLKETEGLRMEFRAIKDKNSFDYLTSKRIKPSSQMMTFQKYHRFSKRKTKFCFKQMINFL